MINPKGTKPWSHRATEIAENTEKKENQKERGWGKKVGRRWEDVAAGAT
jgi:hypothetical protein